MEMKPMNLPVELVLHVITCSLPKYPNVLLHPSHPITQTLLSFTLVCHETRRVAVRALLKHCIYLSSEHSIRSFLLSLSDRPELCKVSALSLSPFEDTIDNQPTAHWVRELFQYTSPYLRRLVIDIPLRGLSPDDDHLNVRRILRDGFMSLENLEEFVSVRDELYLDTANFRHAPELWRDWKHLKRLALYNVDATSAFWLKIARMPKLDTLVLTRADGLTEIDIKDCYFSGYQAPTRPLKVLLVDVAADQIRAHDLERDEWEKADPKKLFTIMTYNVPTLYDDEDAIEVCQDYVKSGAEYGTLWGWEGDIIQHPPKPQPEETDEAE